MREDERDVMVGEEGRREGMRHRGRTGGNETQREGGNETEEGGSETSWEGKREGRSGEDRSRQTTSCKYTH